MTWQNWVERLIDGSKGNIKDAGVYCLNGVVCFASAGMKVEPQQVKELVESKSMSECGPMVGDLKCMLVKDDRDNEQSYCLHLKANKAGGKKTVCVGQCKTVIVVAIGEPDTCIATYVFDTTKSLRDHQY